MAKRLQLRRDIDNNWTNNNPVLSLGELGYVTDTGVLKIGDGSTVWNSLDYFVPQSTDDIPEGTNSLYYTDARALDAVISIILSASANSLAESQSYSDSLDTDDISEGSNLYFTDARAISGTLSTIQSASAYSLANSNDYTDSSLSSLIAAAPSSLDTLNELAAALNDDPDFYNTVNDAIDQKLSISTASSLYLTQIDAESTYEPIGSADYAQSAATGYTDVQINALTTSDIEEGSNLYFTNQRALDATIATIVSASVAATDYADSLTTLDIEENTNLYFTNQRALDATSSVITSASAAAVVSSNSYTDTELLSIVDSAPVDLNTLGKISSAINNDENFYLTISDLLDTKLGVVSASNTYLSIIDASNEYLTIDSASSLYVTQDQFDNAVEIAASSSSPSLVEINSQSASYTLQVEDFGKMIEMSSAGSLVLTIPDDPAMSTGFYFEVTQTGIGSILVEGDTGVTIHAENNDNQLFSQYSSAYIYKTDADEWVMLKGSGGIILRSNNGTLYSISVDNDGSLITTEA